MRTARRTTDVGRAGLRPAAVAALEFLLLAAAIALLAFVVVQLRLVVLPLILAVFVSTLLVPPARTLQRAGVPRLAATGLVVGAALGAAAGVVALVLPAFIDQADDVEREVASGIQEVLAIFGIAEEDVDRYLDEGLAWLRDNSGTLSQGLLSGAVLVAEAIAGLLLAIVLVFFFVNDGPSIWRWVVAQFPARHHDTVDAIGARAWATIGGYLRGVAVVALVDSVLIALVLVVVGVPLVLPLAALTFLGAFFPLVGAAVAGAAAAVVALVAVGPWAALIVLAAIVVIQQLEGDILYPLIVGQALSLHPVAILLLLTAGGVVAGVVGALLAIPFGAVVWDAVRYIRAERDPSPERRDTATR